MKQYTKLPIPKDTAWDDTRFKWGSYVHWRIRYFFTGVWNIIRWAPTIYKDKDWDDFYITKLLQKKIEHQRAYLVNANRHVNIDRDNFWMTIVLNLLERKHESYYELEPYDYIKYGKRLGDPPIQDASNVYVAKYPSASRAVKKGDMYDPTFHNSRALAMYMGDERQNKANRLIFKILERHSHEWWD
jgi:hypothetical protein